MSQTLGCSSPTRHHLHIRGIIQAFSPGCLPVLTNSVTKGGEAVARVEHRKNENTHDDHDSLERNELGLIAHELAPPSTSQLWDTIDTSNEDAEVRDDDGEDEAAERRLVEECHRFIG